MPHSNVRKFVNLIGCLNTIYNTKYKIVGHEGLKNTLSRFTQVNYDLINTQL